MFHLKDTLSLAACIVIASASAAAQDQAANDAALAQGPSSPVAYVYVSNEISSNNWGVMQVYGYAAAANGKLTPIPGSPFKSANVSWMAGNGKYLFGNEIVNSEIESFAIGSSGALKLTETYSAGSGALVGPVQLDHSGGVLHSYISEGGSDYFRDLAVNGSNGKLSQVGQVPISFGGYDWLGFLSNDKFAYAIGNACSNQGGLFAFKRASNGAMTDITIADPMPETPEGNHNYCVQDLATAPSGHVVALLVDKNVTNATPVLAAFSSEANGDLTTTNTHSDMPKIGVTNEDWLRMSPDGKFVAVGGESGLQLFHVNGGAPLTKYKTLLSGGSAYPVQMYWDNANHLYAIGQNQYAIDTLWVFTVTSSGVTQAPGSPYELPNPNWDIDDYMIVVTK